MVIRARNSCLQTRKMRVDIQFCELKIKALEKSCEFDISSQLPNPDLGLKDVSASLQ